MPTPGPLELVIILVIALLILGPGKLPDVGAALGKSIREFRKASSDIQESVRVDTSPLPPAASAAPTQAQASPAVPAQAAPAAPAPTVPTAGPAPAPTGPEVLAAAPAVAATAAGDVVAGEAEEVATPTPIVAATAADLPGAPSVATTSPTGPADESTPRDG